MEFTQWSSTYSVGDPMMDAYHHVFFEAIRQFAEALPNLKSSDIEERIQFLVNYTAMHFESEERLLEQTAYPDLEEHRRCHAAFRDRIDAIQRNYRAQPSQELAERLLQLSQDWLQDHILCEDMKYRDHLKQ